MTRWLEAARRATARAPQGPKAGVLSVLSVLSEGGKGKERAQFEEVATTRHPEPVPMTQRAKARATVLPTSPPTCAVCGAADWQVSLTDTKRRTLHVACWQAELGAGGARLPLA